MAKFKTKDVQVEAYRVGELALIFQYNFQLLPEDIKKKFFKGELFVSCHSMAVIFGNDNGGGRQTNLSESDYIFIYENGRMLTASKEDFDILFKPIPVDSGE